MLSEHSWPSENQEKPPSATCSQINGLSPCWKSATELTFCRSEKNIADAFCASLLDVTAEPMKRALLTACGVKYKKNAEKVWARHAEHFSFHILGSSLNPHPKWRTVTWSYVCISITKFKAVMQHKTSPNSLPTINDTLAKFAATFSQILQPIFPSLGLFL